MGKVSPSSTPFGVFGLTFFSNLYILRKDVLGTIVGILSKEIGIENRFNRSNPRLVDFFKIFKFFCGVRGFLKIFNFFFCRVRGFLKILSSSVEFVDF